MQVKLKIGEAETKSIEISVSAVSVSSVSDCNVRIQSARIGGHSIMFPPDII